MQGDVYAHRFEDAEGNTLWQSLVEHLTGVAQLAGAFSEAFGSEEWGYLSGLWHDLGKYQDAFQRRIRGEPVRTEHAGIGALIAANAGLHPLAFAIAGHHGGLPNFASTDESGGLKPLKERLRDNESLLAAVRDALPRDLVQRKPNLPPQCARADDPLSIELWTRFLFSALVDADWLDTEAFMAPERASLRVPYPTIPELRQRLDQHIDALMSGLDPATQATAVNRARREILDACRAAAHWEPGLFSLTAPTGGGKTLAGLSFALKHAQEHDLRRVIVVIPYTSIIEQNAETYRKALGPENVLEHHANLDPQERTEREGKEITARKDLASENWDAPVIVTTSVQFFESLFANRRGRCRKVHNIARSVVVLDEVQTLPPGLLLPMLDVLRRLVDDYGCSIVLSTATQPALEQRKTFECGLADVREIVPDPANLAKQLDRVSFEWPEPHAEPMAWEDLAHQLARHDKVLAIVHKRDDARQLGRSLAGLVPSDTVFHLSALMCPKHRLAALAKVKEQLEKGLPCRLVSTQLVEAGVDLDFPVVYRALGGLDSMVQAAGRCNREGRLEKGRVVIFKAQTKPPQGTPTRALQIAEGMLGAGTLAAPGPADFNTFFRGLYAAEEKDRRAVQAARRALDFAAVAHRFKLIEDGFSHPIIVPYGDAQERLDDLERNGPNRDSKRALQPYTVQIYDRAFTQGLQDGVFVEVAEGTYAVNAPYAHQYDLTYGLVVGDESTPDPGALMV